MPQVLDLHSKSELNEYLSRKTYPKVLIQTEKASPNQFKIVIIDKLTVGLADYSFGVPIQVHELGFPNSVLIGHESEVVCIAKDKGTVSWCFELNSPFYHLENIRDGNLLVIVEEAGVHVLTNFGIKKWSISTDIITSYKIENSDVHISTMDDQVIIVDIYCGKVKKL